MLVQKINVEKFIISENQKKKRKDKSTKKILIDLVINKLAAQAAGAAPSQ